MRAKPIVFLLCGLVVAAGLLAGCEAKDRDAVCDPDQIQCGDECVDVDSNPVHCGGCDLVCGPARRG